MTRTRPIRCVIPIWLIVAYLMVTSHFGWLIFCEQLIKKREKVKSNEKTKGFSYFRNSYTFCFENENFKNILLLLFPKKKRHTIFFSVFMHFVPQMKIYNKSMKLWPTHVWGYHWLVHLLPYPISIQKINPSKFVLISRSNYSI